MSNTTRNKRVKRLDSGYVMLAVLVLASIGAALMYRALTSSATEDRTSLASRSRNSDYMTSEDALQRAVSWLRSQSTKMALPFSRNNFYTNFDKTSPTVGTNDSSSFTIPTKIKMNGTSNSVLLLNGSGIGTSYYPASTDTATGAAFNSSSSFASATVGNDLVRITLVDAIAADSTKDYGDLPAATPATDFNPVYRVDAFDSLTGGGHVFGYILGSLVVDNGMGFYGRDLVELRQNCDSYLSNNGVYSNASKRANCTVGGGSTAQVHQNSLLYGTLKTQGTITSSSPFGGKVCSDFVANCPNPGQTCQGASCNVPGLPTYSTWATYCPSNQGNVTINANSTLTVAGNASNQKCWNSVTIGNNKTLTLTSTAYPYFIDTFNIPNNGVVNFAPNPATGTINLYVRTFTGGTVNGNQLFNINNKPYQLRIHYLGNSGLTLNGNAGMNAFIVAPYAGVTVQGNFTFQGGIKTTSLTATGSGVLRYDESGDIPTISDVTYRKRNFTQRYR